MSESESEDSVSTEHEDDSCTAKVEESTSKKRQHEDVQENVTEVVPEVAKEADESDNEWIGPMPTEAAAPAKKKKGLLFRSKKKNFATHSANVRIKFQCSITRNFIWKICQTQTVTKRATCTGTLSHTLL